ncbi:hypothetical protein COCON_G00080960 [Conger conger]|uniref:Uncharacterized protein n=1 Tax=Conger conger TaxID=82655 RepID=A0A9Q1DPU0_CONCO|nr:hypothetical protein COCON_G00080960 [Conger conger]
MTLEMCDPAHKADTPLPEPSHPVVNGGVAGSHQGGGETVEGVPGPAAEDDGDKKRWKRRGWVEGYGLELNGERCGGAGGSGSRRAQLGPGEVGLETGMDRGGAMRNGEVRDAHKLQATEGFPLLHVPHRGAEWKDADDEEEEDEGHSAQRRANCDRFSSRFERTVERAVHEEEEGEEGSQQTQDLFSSTFEHVVERAAQEEEQGEEEEGEEEKDSPQQTQDRFSSSFERVVERAAQEEEQGQEEEREEEKDCPQQTQDRFSSSFERVVERAAQEGEQGEEEEREEEKDSPQQTQDRFSSSFERVVEAELLRGGCYSSQDSLDALSQADETHSCVSIRAPLTPLIQQRALESRQEPDPVGLATVAEQQAVATDTEPGGAGLESPRSARRPLRPSPGRPWRNSITSSQSENVLNRPLPRAFQNGFHSDAHGSLGSPSSLPNSIR